MSLVTAHWSATSPVRIKDYHVEFALTTPLPNGLNDALGEETDPGKIDWKTLYSHFTIWKNTNFDIALTYGTYHLNHDPRDQSPNIEVGALCMGGEGVGVTGPWGQWPYTYAHSWIHAGIIGRICNLKKIDGRGMFTDPDMQNNPLFNVSTHAERAIQTPDGPAANLRPTFGYFIYSGDPDSRWDIAVRDVKDAPKLQDPENARIEAVANATWLRSKSTLLITRGLFGGDMWGLDKPA